MPDRALVPMGLQDALQSYSREEVEVEEETEKECRRRIKKPDSDWESYSITTQAIKKKKKKNKASSRPGGVRGCSSRVKSQRPSQNYTPTFAFGSVRARVRLESSSPSLLTAKRPRL